MTTPKIENPTKNEGVEMDELTITEKRFFQLVAEKSPADWQKLSALKICGIITSKGPLKPAEVLHFISRIKNEIEKGVSGMELISFVEGEMVNDTVSGEDFLRSKFVSQVASCMK
jgi:hypothetical protein